MRIQTRSQENAKRIYNQVEQISRADERLKKEYGIWCQRLPILILRSGLSQATGFLWAKAEQNESKASGILLKHLAKHLNVPNAETPADFHRHINRSELQEYQRLTRLTLEASLWYKRYAESLFDVKSGEENA